MLADVMPLIAAKLVERGVNAPLLDGREALPQDTGASRYVWIETAHSFAPRRASGNPQALLTCMAGCELHVLGVSAAPAATPAQHRAVALELARKFLVALHRVAEGSYELSSGTLQNDGELVYGAEYVLQFAVAIPIVDDEWPTVKLGPSDFVSTDSIMIGGTPIVAC